MGPRTRTSAAKIGFEMDQYLEDYRV
jgi:hypothetical protein